MNYLSFIWTHIAFVAFVRLAPPNHEFFVDVRAMSYLTAPESSLLISFLK